jgi:deoxyribonuclease IV
MVGDFDVPLDVTQSVLGTGVTMSNKMLLGAHVSIEGGVHNSIGRGVHLGCTAIQIFTKNATRWKSRSLPEDVIREFRVQRDEADMFVVAHDSYLINLGSPDDGLWKRSISAFVQEMERAEQLGIPYVVMHPGAHKGAGEKAGIGRIITAINTVLKATDGFKVCILVENTAGQGTVVGYRFEHVAEIINGVKQPERMGACIDTCHAFAAGYDMRTEETYQTTMKELDDVIGYDRVKVIHLNDCKKGLGQRVDRHEHIGKGRLGLEPFRFIMNDPHFSHVPKLIETPKRRGLTDMDPVNLDLLRSLVL